MNTTKICRYCECTEIYTKLVSAKGDGCNFLPIGGFFFPSNAKYRLEICGKCGHTAWFVAYEEHLDKVRQKFDLSTNAENS